MVCLHRLETNKRADQKCTIVIIIMNFSKKISLFCEKFGDFWLRLVLTNLISMSYLNDAVRRQNFLAFMSYLPLQLRIGMEKANRQNKR